MKQEILLSISIMVSGREETTEKCISSLDELRKKVPCELILTDTGCSQKLRKRLEKKADQIISFVWCNDFAAARNVGLKAANGEWFLFMDDDEWFESTTQIEEFFINGEYKRYESAFYVVRNYGDMEGTVWRDTPIIRMVKRRNNMQFIYPIHESLWPVLNPVKQLEDYVHHYGYASDDPAVQKAKRERNLSLLLPAIEKDPGCLHHYLQAVSEYVAAGDYTSALRMAQQGVEHCEPKRVENGNHLYGLYAAEVRMGVRLAEQENKSKEDRRLIADKQYETAVQRGEEILQQVSLTKLAKASIYGDLTIAYGNTGRNEKCIYYLWEYLKRKDFFESHRDAWTVQQTIVLDSCFESYQYRKVMGAGMASVLNVGEPEKLEKLLSMETLDWWMETVQKWYTAATDVQREKWKYDFGKMAGAENAERYPQIMRLYRSLTSPGQEKQKRENPQQGEITAEQTAPTKEMELLAVQLKEKIRQLMAQEQVEAALQTIQGLQKFFPNDAELVEWRKMLEKL